MKHAKPLLVSDIPVPAWWQTEYAQIESYIRQNVKQGEVRELAVSSGQRKIYSVTYGTAEQGLHGTANFNSALGSGSEAAYVNKAAREKPVLMFLAGVHGHEVEGMIAAQILMGIMETGKDLLQRDQSELRKQLEQFRMVIYPLLNPDGRIRVPYAGWVGLPGHEMTRYGQGTRKNGQSYTWRPSKAVHPMQGDVGILGGYFDDRGINLMHDEWYEPMSKATGPLLKQVAQEAPDLLLDMHSYEIDAGILETVYIPKTLKQEIVRYTQQYVYPRIQHYGIRTASLPPVYAEGEEGAMHPPLNLTSMCYHAGATLPCVFESPHGLAENMHSYEQLHNLHLALIESAAAYLDDLQTARKQLQ